MIGTIYINGIIGEDTTLLDVIKQVKSQSTAESFLVKIDSVGGYVDTGNDIYNYLKNLSVPVTTFTTEAYSIASVIFMAGSTRIIPEGAERALMIHLPWMEAQGNHSELTSYLKDLKNTEDELVSFYAESLQLDKTTIHSLLKSETYLNANQAFDLGFATQLQVAQKAVAKLKNNNKEEKEEENFMNKISKRLDNIFNVLTGKIKAELRLQDATGVEIVFADLDASQAPEMDSKATVDNKPAEGEFLMADGSTMVFDKGLLTEMKPAEEVEEVIEDVVAEEAPVALEDLEEVTEDVPAEDAEATPEEKDAMIADLQDQVMELKAKLAEYEVEVVEEEVVDVEEVNKMVELIEAMAAKQVEMETKYQALAKSVGSDFNSENKKEIKTSVKGTSEALTRAQQILNSK